MNRHVGCVSGSVTHQSLNNGALRISSSRTLHYLIFFINQTGFLYLDIKIAILLKENGIPENSDKQLDPQHIFHEKVGTFTDSNNDRLAFNGSNNESIGGWERNVESFHVYCSWEGGRELDRVEEEISRFEQLWYDIAPNVRVFEVPEAVQKKLLRYAPSDKPAWNPKENLILDQLIMLTVHS